MQSSELVAGEHSGLLFVPTGSAPPRRMCTWVLLAAMGLHDSPCRAAWAHVRAGVERERAASAAEAAAERERAVAARQP